MGFLPGKYFLGIFPGIIPFWEYIGFLFCVRDNENFFYYKDVIWSYLRLKALYKHKSIYNY